MVDRLAARMPDAVKEPLRPLWQRGAWIRKARIVRSYHSGRLPPGAIPYVLWDPEHENFTYDLANWGELTDVMSAALDVDSSAAERWAQEAREDPLLARVGGRRQHRRARYGRRIGWYVAVRALRPSLVVETGVHEGLGSALLLRALQRNAAEDASGRLLSVDIDPKAGRVVPASLRDRWDLVIGSSFDVLEPSIGERRVGVLIHDSDHTYECERFELDVGLRHAADRIALITDNNHVTTALDDVLADIGVPRHRFQERPRGHFYPGAALGIGVISRPRQPQPSA